jgi:hypothetical protein
METKMFKNGLLANTAVLTLALSACQVKGTLNVGTSESSGSGANLSLPVDVISAALKPNQAMGWTDSNSNSLTISWNAPANGIYECKFGHQSLVGSKSFSDCSTGISLTKDAAKDEGLYLLQIRNKQSDGSSGETSTFKAYFHKSLNGTTNCTHPFTVADVEAAARSALPLNGTFGNTSSVASPRIQLKKSDETDLVEVRSLRRSFTLSSDHKIISMIRNRASTAKGTCEAVKLVKHPCIAPAPGSREDGVYSCAQYSTHLNFVTCDAIASNSDLDVACFTWNGHSLALTSLAPRTSQNSRGIWSTLSPFPSSSSNGCGHYRSNRVPYIAKTLDSTCDSRNQGDPRFNVLYLAD